MSRNFDRIVLREEYRFIERGENEINGAWKGAHLLLFFLAFVFGSFCTFCFHMLMYLFNEKCVLFPKLLSLKTLRHNVIYDMIPNQKNGDILPVDFLSTQWVDQSECYLPTYVPLVSGIFGLVWTTMFLMCSTGSRTLTGLQKPWRVLPPIFIFSLAMGGLCIYSSTVTHRGLKQLCAKLGEISGSSTCTYTINVVTLAYERRIRGVYQATQLTILSAWLHTSCWLLSAALAVVRVLLAVDFQLVRITAELQGDIDKMLERHEKQIRNVFPDDIYAEERTIYSDEYYDDYDEATYPLYAANARKDLQPTKMQTKYKGFADEQDDSDSSQLIFFEQKREVTSDLSLLPEEQTRLDRNTAIKKIPKDKRFIFDLVFNLINSLKLPQSDDDLYPASEQSLTDVPMVREDQGLAADHDIQMMAELKERLKEDLEKDISLEFEKSDLPMVHRTDHNLSFTKKQFTFDSAVMTAPEDSSPGPSTSKAAKKSNLKNTAIQTDRKGQKVKINAPFTDTSADEVDKETQTTNNKEKQD